LVNFALVLGPVFHIAPAALKIGQKTLKILIYFCWSKSVIHSVSCYLSASRTVTTYELQQQQQQHVHE